MNDSDALILPGLTDEQRAVVRHPQGHARVSAVAGSGKTTTMVARIGKLLADGITAERIMVLMFNRSARDGFVRTMEIRQKGLGNVLPEIRTFHSLGARLVDSFSRKGALPSYRLETRDSVIEKLARQAGMLAKKEAGGEAGWLVPEELADFITFIDRVKATLAGPDQVYKETGPKAGNSFFVRGYQMFEELRHAQHIRFYADLIHEPLLAMQADTELREWVGNRVDHIIVDEYQDINETQQQLLRIVAGNRAEVMVVGDVDQCIYEWRGAKPEYITSRFEKDFPRPRNYILSHTFRYGHQLSLAANHLITHNRRRDRKLCVSHRTNPVTRLSMRCEETGLSHPVIQILRDWLADGRSLTEATVLVRLYAQSVVVELALLEAGIPYRLEGGAEVFSCPEILALTGYLHLASGSLGSMPRQQRVPLLEAMFSQPHLGIPRERLARLAETAADTPGELPELLRDWSRGDLPEFLRKRFQETAEKYHWIMSEGGSRPAHLLLADIVAKLDLYEFYRNLSARPATAENRVKTCQALIDFSRSRNYSVTGLLAELEALARGRRRNGDTLLITSVHRAKGLEWPLVILPGLENGLFPFGKGQESEDLEDERRLFYVAITRAREWLVAVHPPELSFSHSLKSYADCPANGGRVSRFLREARPGFSRKLGELLEGDGTSPSMASSSTPVADAYLKAVSRVVEFTGEIAEPLAAAETHILKIDEIAEGQHVVHPHFGPGIVTAIHDRRQGRLTVTFPEAGEMILLAAYARLQEPL